MKKTLSLMAAAGAVLLILVLLLWNPTDAVALLNENSHLPVPLCTQESQVQPAESLMYVPGFGGYALDNDQICIHLSGWPDAADPYHVTGIDLFAPGYHILGLQVGSSFADARSVLARYGFTSKDDRIFCYADVSVILYEQSGIVNRINVRVSTTNKKGLVF